MAFLYWRCHRAAFIFLMVNSVLPGLLFADPDDKTNAEKIRAMPGVRVVLDVDGTLTPHAGDHERSLFRLELMAYMLRSTDFEYRRIKEFIDNLPQPAIILTNNTRDKVTRFLRFIEVPDDKIDFERSKFRNEFVSKVDVLREWSLLFPIVFFDDDPRNIPDAPIANVHVVFCPLSLLGMPDLNEITEALSGR